jgi:streptogramin lyase
LISGPSKGAFRRRVALIGAAVLAATAIVALGPTSAQGAGLKSVTDFPTPGGDPWGTAADGAGRIWVALPGCDPSPTCSPSTPPGKLALFDPDTQAWATVVALPAGYGQPLFVAVDATGKVWFTMPSTNAIGRYDPSTATVTQWPVPTAGSGPWGLTIDSSGTIWFTEHYVNKIASFDPASRSFREIATPATNSNPYGITVDDSDNVWFTENNDAVALIGEYTKSGTLNEYKIRSGATAGTGLTPHLVTIDASGNPWWSEGWVSSIGRLLVGSAQRGTNNGVSEFHYTPTCGSCGSHTSGIAADGQGLIWLDDSLQNTFGSFPVAGGNFSFYSSPGGHPHDGLIADLQNRIWFDEEFANRLAEAIPDGATSNSSSTSSTSMTTTTVPSGSTLAADTFRRPDQTFFGTASDGHVWGGDANSRNLFSVAGNTGRVGATGSTSYSALLGSGAADVDVRVTGSMSGFVNGNFGPVLRFADANNWYKAFIDGSQLWVQKKVGGVTTMLGSVPFTATAGTAYTIEFRAIGSTLNASVWPASGSAPSSWMFTAADSSLTTGVTGIRFLTQNATASITSFQANAL